MANKQTVGVEPEAKDVAAHRVMYNADVGRAWRRMSYRIAKEVCKQPAMSWAEYCNAKIKAYTDYWTAEKAFPNHSRPKKVSADKLAAHKKQLETLEVKRLRLAAIIAANA